MSPSAEIAENCTESDTSEISEKSASILKSKAEENTDEDKTGLMNKDVVKDQNEVSAPSNIQTKLKPLVDYDDTFNNETQETVEDSVHEDGHEDSESDFNQELGTLSEIPTSQLDTSIPSEFDSDSDKEAALDDSEGKEATTQS